LWIANNQRTIVTDIYQDFVVSAHSDFFQGQTDWGLVYWHNHFWETGLSKQEEELIARKPLYVMPI
jgi:hypothetical protein